MRIIQLRIIYSFLRKTSMIVPSGMASIYRRMLTFDGCSFGKEPKVMFFFSLTPRKMNQKEGCYPQGPLQRGMQPLLLSLLHFGILDPSKGRDVFIDYAERWSIVRAWVLSTTLNAGR